VEFTRLKINDSLFRPTCRNSGPGEIHEGSFYRSSKVTFGKEEFWALKVKF
jgi:hypothetical protein